MQYLAHRVNKVDELEALSPAYGVELDLRDNVDGTLYINHDPFVLGESFEAYLKHYHHGTMILNVKSERIEHQILKALKPYPEIDYFFLDCSFPMIKLLSDMGERKIALRFSEFEGMETLKVMAGKVDWVWVDCFTYLPLDQKTFDEIKALGYKICIVSPELQGQAEKIEAYAEQIKGLQIDAICTKEYNIERWKQLLV